MTHARFFFRTFARARGFVFAVFFFRRDDNDDDDGAARVLPFFFFFFAFSVYARDAIFFLSFEEFGFEAL
jgi:hypothetical protein